MNLVSYYLLTSMVFCETTPLIITEEAINCKQKSLKAAKKQQKQIKYRVGRVDCVDSQRIAV